MYLKCTKNIFFFQTVVHIGACMPTACSSNETATLVEQILLKNRNNEFAVINRNFSIIHSKVVEVTLDTFTNPFFIFLV